MSGVMDDFTFTTTFGDDGHVEWTVSRGAGAVASSARDYDCTPQH
jgi:hypothetical protein